MSKDKFFKVIKLSSIIICLFNVLLFFSMRCCWSGISKTLQYESNNSLLILHLPVIVMVLMFLVAIANIILLIIKKNNKIAITFLSVDIIFLIANIIIIALGAKDYIRFIAVEFLKSLVVVFVVLVLLFFIFIYPKSKLKDSKIFKIIVSCSILLASVASLVNFSINTITYKPVVYAVENTYQIVFSSSSNSLAWIDVGQETYYDLTAGSQKSYDKIHKITVPMEKLNNEKCYTINCQQVIYRGPFGGLKGKTITQKYNFRPVDSSNGVTYFAISDVHEGLKCSSKTASYVSNMEFLVVAGDISSMVDTFADANIVNKLAHNITKGEIPVVYARGNHEVKGKYAEEFYKFVGSVNGKFYYNFYLDNIYGIVLDIGEDHDDDWWEYYETARYDLYRQEQLDLLSKEINSKNYLNYDYRMVVCHIPLMYVNARKNHEYFKKEATELLNQMYINISLSGHQHDLLVFEPNTLPSNEKLPYNSLYKNGTFKGYVTNYQFPNLLLSKRGLTQTDSNKLTNRKSQIGLMVEVDFDNNVQHCTYLNSYGDNIDIVNPFVEGKDYGNKITISLLDNSFQ